MATNATLPKLEAKVQVRPINGDEGWRDALDFDPILLPVEDETGIVDVFDSTVMDLVDAIVSADAAFSEHLSDSMLRYRLVWSAAGTDVKGTCPVCDDVFPLAEGGIGDTYNEGYDAVWCGCDPKDQGMDD